MPIGKQIRLYLIEKGIRQNWLSEQTKISLSKLNMSLNGKRKLLAEEYAKIVEALNVDANTFIKSK